MARGRGKRRQASSVEVFLARLPTARRRRMQAIRLTLLQPRVRESVIGTTLVLETHATRIRVASLTRHIGVYFPTQPLLDGVRARHPELRCGSRSVAIRDDQYLPLYELQNAALRTFLPQATPAAPHSLPSGFEASRKLVAHSSFPAERNPERSFSWPPLARVLTDDCGHCGRQDNLLDVK